MADALLNEHDNLVKINAGLKEENEALQDKIAEVSASFIERQKAVVALKEEVQTLISEKSALIASIDIIKMEEASRNHEKELELNAQAQELLDQRASFKSQVELYERRLKEVEEREKVLSFHVKQINDREQEVAELLKKNDKDREYLASLLSSNQEIREELLRKQVVLKEKIVEAQKAVDLYVERANKIEADREKLSDYQELIEKQEVELLAKQAELSKDIETLNEKSKSLDEKAEVMRKREDLLREWDKTYAGELKVIEEEHKKIQLGWLQINKRINDKKLDIDLEAFKSSL